MSGVRCLLNRTFHLLAAFCLASLSGIAAAQSSSTTKLQQQLSYVDLGVHGIGQFTSSTSGPITIPAADVGTTVSQSASTTVGALVTLRYAPRPYLGAEFNGSYARFTEQYSVPPFQIQTQVNEFTLGYLVTPPYTVFGLKPYASAGGGIVRFAPTKGGGQGAPSEGVPGYYYNLGVQKIVLSDNFGVRVGFRQLFYTAPDFYQNYLTINKRTSTFEPMIGFYLRF